jgi:hypothetical protein
MHDTAYEIGRRFFEAYGTPQSVIIEFGSLNVNGTLRDFCPAGAQWIGLDLTECPGVDIVINTMVGIPLASRSADIVIASSVFEHDLILLENVSRNDPADKATGHNLSERPVKW